ncbi:MAG TPA: aminotransferase class I/II-fold pyridoxal phosphate-dependent enzyme [Victivallales bacterium]|nr:aminotransferase class I/II-fold pyridoxal phosphate-dependent enzyme [Victivallales bacterium]
MNIDNFKLERYFAKYEFKTKYLLSCSDCDGFSLKYILNCASDGELNLWNSLTFGYTESCGHPLLRESISKLYKKMMPENILVSSPGEANFILMNLLLKPSDHVICISPSYQSLYQVTKSIGCQLSYWKPNVNTWHYDPNDLKNLVQKNTKLIIINFPHNPTGAFPSEKELLSIVKIAKDKDIYLFSDEIYHLLTLGDTKEIPLVCDIYEKGISLWGMAKSFGLAGLRIGWLASQDIELLDKVASFKDYLTICNSAPSEILSLIAINNKNEFIIPNLTKIQKNIDLFTKFKEAHPDIIDFIPPKAGSTCFTKLNIPDTAMEFSQKLIEQTGIMVVPSELFEYGSKHIRIGFGRDNFPEILNIMDEYINNR